MAGDIEENPGPTLMERRRSLKLQLESAFDDQHTIQWKIYKSVDLRFILMLAGDVEKNPGPTYLTTDKRRQLKLKLEADYKDSHRIQWHIDKPESPLTILIRPSHREFG